jgi:hypothetical protein
MEIVLAATIVGEPFFFFKADPAPKNGADPVPFVTHNLWCVRRVQNSSATLKQQHCKQLHCKKKYGAVWNQKLYIGEYSGISSLKLKNSGI